MIIEWTVEGLNEVVCIQSGKPGRLKTDYWPSRAEVNGFRSLLRRGLPVLYLCLQLTPGMHMWRPMKEAYAEKVLGLSNTNKVSSC